MAEAIAKGYVDVVADKAGFNRSVSRLGDGNGPDKAGAGIGKKMALGIGAAVAAAGIADVVSGFLGDSVSAASNLGESINAVNKIFGDSSKEILDWGKNNATQFGLSQASFNSLATPLGALLKNSGIQDVTGNTVELTKRAADLASVFNVDVSTALEAINSGLKGEADPLEKFGIGLTAAKVEAQALADTGKKTAKSLTDQEKAQGRLNLIMKESAAVAGDFTDTSKDYANAQRIAAAKTEELQAKLGVKLIPVMQKVTEIKLALVTLLVDKVVPAFTRLGAFLGDKLGPAFNEIRGGLKAFVAAFKTGGDDVTSSGFAGALERLGLIARRVFDWLKENVPPILAAVGNIIQDRIVPVLQRLAQILVDDVLPVAQSVFGWLRDNVPSILAAVSSFISDKLIPAFQQIGEWISVNVIPALQSLAGWVRDKLIPALSDLWASFQENILPVLIRLAGYIRDEVLPVLAKIGEFIVEKVVPFVGQLVEFILTKFLPAFFEVVGWIADNLLPVFEKIGTFIKEKVIPAIGDFIGAIDSIVSTLAGWVLKVWEYGGMVLDFFREIPGKIADFFVGLAETITAPFRKAFNEVQSLYDNTIGKLGSVADKVVPGGGGLFDGGISKYFRASGGPVRAGQPYIVGEHRPELFVPDRDGTILPRVPDGGNTFNLTLAGTYNDVNVSEQFRRMEMLAGLGVGG